MPPTLPSLEPGSLLTTARNLLDALLGTILDDPDAAVRALLALGAREGARRRALPAHDAASGAPIATTPLARAYVHDFLATEVRETIGVYVAAGVADDLVGRATMGVEFVAGVETEAPGTVDAASPTA